VVETLIPTQGVVSSAGLGVGALGAPVLAASFLASGFFGEDFFGAGLFGARSFGVRSTGVGYSKASFLTIGLAIATVLGTFKSLGASFTSSTLTIPFSMERSQPRLCWFVSIFERRAPVALSRV